MITIVPCLEIMKAVTDTNISSSGADVRREAFDLAVELKSLGDVNILLEGILYDRVKHRIEPDHQMFFESICRIDNSAKDVTDFNIVKAINWIVDSESKSRKVIVLTNNCSSYQDSDNVVILTPSDFIYKVKKVLTLAQNKGLFSIDEVLLALFFL